MSPPGPTVVVYTRQQCGLCEKAERLVAAEAAGAAVRLVDVDEDPELQRRYHVRVPVVTVDGDEIAAGRVAPGTVARALRRARARRWVGRWLPDWVPGGSEP